MLSRIKELLFDVAADAGPEDADATFAAAALMVEAASIDGAVTADERSRITGLLCRGFGVDVTTARDVLRTAEQRMADVHQLHPFARTIRSRLSAAERVDLVEMLWEVIHADGRVDDYEANLMRRLGGLLHVGDVEIGAARKRARAREQERPGEALPRKDEIG